MNLRPWLRKRPLAASFVLTTDDGTKTVELGEGSRCFSDAESAIVGCEPTRIEARDKKGNVLRAIPWGDGEKRSGDDSDDAVALAAAAGGELTNVVALAKLLNAAHDAGAARHADAYRLAFEKLVGIVELLSVRLSGMESAWMKTLAKLAQSYENAGEQDDGFDIQKLIAMALPAMLAKNGGGGMLQGLLGAAAQQQAPTPAPRPAPAPTNGTTTKKE